MKLLKFEGLMIYKEKVVYTDNNTKKKKNNEQDRTRAKSLRSWDRVIFGYHDQSFVLEGRLGIAVCLHPILTFQYHFLISWDPKS